MDALVKAALIGTARQPDALPGMGTPIDGLVAGLQEEGAERRMLLAAGALAVYRQAGCRVDHTPESPELAPAESLPVCTARTASFIAGMLRGVYADLLPEALARLARAGQRLPPDLLPEALSGAESLRGALLPVIGARGRWLSQFDPRWNWVAEALPGTDDLPDGAEATWQEGAFAARLEVLRRMRAHDPARGRAWLKDAWPREKADERTRLIEALEAGLSLDDEPFLESALDDRAGGVRKHAAALLARLPGSALSGRMQERARALLSYHPAPPASGMLGKVVRAVRGTSEQDGLLTVTLPPALDAAWQRDGVELKPRGQVGERAWWLIQTLTLVPPSYWPERFGVAAPRLIAAANRDDWGVSLLEGWSHAALLHRDQDWAAALWSWWFLPKHDFHTKSAADLTEIEPMRARLLTLMPRHVADDLLGQALAKQEAALDERTGSALQTLPAPWGAALSRVYLRGLRMAAGTLGSPTQSSGMGVWMATLAHAALALSEDCFAEALQPWQLPEVPPSAQAHWYVQHWRRELERFVEVVDVRRQLSEEIGPHDGLAQ